MSQARFTHAYASPPHNPAQSSRLADRTSVTRAPRHISCVCSKLNRAFLTHVNLAAYSFPSPVWLRWSLQPRRTRMFRKFKKAMRDAGLGREASTEEAIRTFDRWIAQRAGEPSVAIGAWRTVTAVDGGASRDSWTSGGRRRQGPPARCHRPVLTGSPLRHREVQQDPLPIARSRRVDLLGHAVAIGWVSAEVRQQPAQFSGTPEPAGRPGCRPLRLKTLFHRFALHERRGYGPHAAERGFVASPHEPRL